MVSVSYQWSTQPLRSIQQNGLLLVPTGVEERLGPGKHEAAVKRRLSKVFWQMAVKKKVSVVFCETGRHFFKINLNKLLWPLGLSGSHSYSSPAIFFDP